MNQHPASSCRIDVFVACRSSCEPSPVCEASNPRRTVRTVFTVPFAALQRDCEFRDSVAGRKEAGDSIHCRREEGGCELEEPSAADAPRWKEMPLLCCTQALVAVATCCSSAYNFGTLPLTAVQRGAHRFMTGLGREHNAILVVRRRADDLSPAEGACTTLQRHRVRVSIIHTQDECNPLTNEDFRSHSNADHSSGLGVLNHPSVPPVAGSANLAQAFDCPLVR